MAIRAIANASESRGDTRLPILTTFKLRRGGEVDTPPLGSAGLPRVLKNSENTGLYRFAPELEKILLTAARLMHNDDTRSHGRSEATKSHNGTQENGAHHVGT